MNVTSAMHEVPDDDSQPALTDEQKAEFDRRLAAHDADPTKAKSWEDVVKYVRRPRESPQVRS